jgi:hypothetical protein
MDLKSSSNLYLTWLIENGARSEVTEKYGYSRFIDTWGMGTQGLFWPEDAWNDLSSDKKQVMVEYAQYCGLKAIVVGKQLSQNNISLDRTVWER